MPTRRSAFTAYGSVQRQPARLDFLERLRMDEPVRSPFLGYTPSLNPSLLGFDGGKTIRNLIEIDMKLKWVPGWTELPLPSGATNIFPIGEDSAAFGTVAFAASVDTPQPVVLVGQIHVQDPAITPQIAPIIVTGSSETDAAEVGHFVTIDSSGELTEIPYDAAVIAANEEIQDGRDSLPDLAMAPWGGSGSPNPSGAVAFACGHNDRVFIWDPGDGGFPGTVNTLSRIATNNTGVSANFFAESVENFADRLFFFNTKENGGTHYNRVRWTALGTLDADTFNKTGYGFVDLNELQKPGKRIQRIGDFLACYSGDGVVFLERQPIPTAPVSKLYHSADRGLLSKHSLCQVGRDLHFGIFTDGWFFLNSQGVWTEAGQFAGERGEGHNKWKSKFFQILDKTKLDRIYVAYDGRLDLIYVTFPTTDAAENALTWVFNLKTDSVWPIDVGFVCFGEMDDAYAQEETLGGALAAETLGGTYALTAIGDFATSPGFLALVHGSLSGKVYVHREEIWERDGVTPDWEYESHWVSGEDPSKERELTRVYVERDRHPTLSSAITIDVSDEDGDSDGETVPTGAGTGVETIYGDARIHSTTHKLRLSGQHPQCIRALSVHGWESQSRSKRPEGA